jgi:hypothetical protein
MVMLTLDCARCPAKMMTHDIRGLIPYPAGGGDNFDVFVQCRACSTSAIWQVYNKSTVPMANLIATGDTLDHRLDIIGLVRPRLSAAKPPEHTPSDLSLTFDEAADCLAIGAWNASSAMFRKILDQISKDKMNASAEPPPDKRTRFNLKA